MGSFFDTSNAGVHDKITMCVLDSAVMSRSLSNPAYAQIEIITCQPHEVCSPMSHDVNIGKYGLGICKMVRPPIKRKMCIVKETNARMGPIINPAAIQIDLIECEANEVCVPYPSEEKGGMP